MDRGAHQLRAVAKAFTNRRIEQLRPDVEAIVAACGRPDRRRLAADLADKVAALRSR